jgi:hypothetical protein
MILNRFNSYFQTMNTNSHIQKASYSLAQLEMNLNALKLQNDYPPCICISGLRNLALVQMVRHCDFRSIIQTLFKLLKIPAEWVLEIKNPPHANINNAKIPFEAFVYLIDNNVKVKVYKLLLNHLKSTKQHKIHLEIVN